MNPGRRTFTWLTAVALTITSTVSPHAVIFLGDSDPDHNTSQPIAALAGSGWQWQGDWRGFAGTPVSSNLFLTAKHLPGTIGHPFQLNGRVYPTVASFPDPVSDLILWKICGSFPDFAPLAESQGPLLGERCVLFGRGMVRGSEVTVTNDNRTSLAGWRWAPADGRLRWGINIITAAGEDYIQATLDSDGPADESMLAGGDSGGGLFVQQAGQWRLAGIHAAVDGPFRYPGTTDEFFAALIDRRGLEQQDDVGSWSEATGPIAQPTALYSTSVAARRDWIESVIATQSDPVLPVLEQASQPTGPFAPDTSATTAVGVMLIRIPIPPSPRYYRLNFCQLTRLRSVRTIDDQLELAWEIVE